MRKHWKDRGQQRGQGGVELSSEVIEEEVREGGVKNLCNRCAGFVLEF